MVVQLQDEGKPLRGSDEYRRIWSAFVWRCPRNIRESFTTLKDRFKLAGQHAGETGRIVNSRMKAGGDLSIAQSFFCKPSDDADQMAQSNQALINVFKSMKNGLAYVKDEHKTWTIDQRKRFNKDWLKSFRFSPLNVVVRSNTKDFIQCVSMAASVDMSSDAVASWDAVTTVSFAVHTLVT
jgi:hypothetical protein